jgi:C1A family cysteine protease
MRIIVATAVFAAVFQLGESLSTAYQTVVPATQQALWGDFKVTFGKNYSSSEEEANRFNVFVANLALIDAKNEAETGTAVHGITKFADRTPEEFHAYLTFVPKPDHGFDVDNVTQPLLAGATVNVDWTGKYTTPIKNQGYCGSCWAFSGVEQMESDYMRKFGKLYKLSTQQATSCAYPQGTGCSGGWPEDAINSANNGFEQEKDYPYISGMTAKHICKS